MKKVFGLFAFMIFAVTMSVGSQAQTFDSKNVYAGGGLGFNNLAGVGSSRGFQFFAGYDFEYKVNEDISTAVEIGFMDSGNFDRLNTSGSSGDATGIWATAVGFVPLSRKVDMVTRFGYDFGDDDGLILGTGLQYKFDTKSALRIEYVAREHVSGLQANILFKF